MRKSSIRILAFILAVIIFGGAIYLYTTGYFSKEETPMAEDGASARQTSFGESVTPVKAVVINSGVVQDAIYVNGSTVSNESVTIASEVAGKINKILFREGSYVKAGTPLVQLDINELQAQRDRLLVRQQLTRKIAERLEGLYKKEGVSLQEYEIAKAEADQVDAELDLVDVQISKRTVNAPFSGLLGLKQVSEGSYLSPGEEIVNLVSTNPINIEFSVPERYSLSIDRGTKVKFKLDGTNEEYSATVIAKEPNIDPTTRTLKLKASAPNPGGRILPGAFANVTVNLQRFGNAIMIPTEAVIPELGGKKVFVYRNGKAESVLVETGIRSEEMIQVLSGLENGDTVITTGILQIRPGGDVTITELN